MSKLCVTANQYVGEASVAAVLDGDEGSGSEGEAVAEKQEKTEHWQVTPQKTTSQLIFFDSVERSSAVWTNAYALVCLRTAFYCMNEKELVEAAVTLLTSAACGEEVLLTDHKVALIP